MKVVRLSENTVLLECDQTVCPKNLDKIIQVKYSIQQALGDYTIEIIPAYASVHITFNPLKIDGKSLIDAINAMLPHCQSQLSPHQGKLVDIPIYYGQEVNYDVDFIAKHANISSQEVIQRHHSKIYTVYALGFAPGFAYLGDIDPHIATPRRKTPRLSVPKGSLGIAETQTAIYPDSSPGGWQIIGRTPMPMIDYKREKMSLLETGDRVKFFPISKQEFISMGGLL
ncbi:MAG: 5-oxoprolinase subunit PxpB [Pseudomonadota bacterium]